MIWPFAVAIFYKSLPIFLVYTLCIVPQKSYIYQVYSSFLFPLLLLLCVVLVRRRLLSDVLFHLVDLAACQLARQADHPSCLVKLLPGRNDQAS